MPLIALLEGDFFNTFIKSGMHFLHHYFPFIGIVGLTLAGSVLMLSEGRPGVDDVFSLSNGQCLYFHSKTEKNHKQKMFLSTWILKEKRRKEKTEELVEVELC